MLRYQNNAFRVLGLSSEASIKEIMQRVNEIKVKRSLSLDIAYDFDFSWIGEIDRSEHNVINSLQRLENPVSRLKEEMFWFWNDTDIDREAIDHLIKGDRQAAHVLWKRFTASDHPDETTISAFVNQMVLSHSSVIGKELTIRYNGQGDHVSGDCKYCLKCKSEFNREYDFCIHCGGKLILKEKEAGTNMLLSDRHWTNWRFAFNRISLIASEDLFWEKIYEKAERINDPRLSSAKVDEIRDSFLCDMVNPNFRFIAQSLFNKDYERTKKHAGLLNGSSLECEILRKGFNETLSFQVTLIKRHCNNAKKEVSEFKRNNIKPTQDIVSIYSRLEQNVTDSVKEGNIVDFNCLSDYGLARDGLANDVKNMAIILNNLLIGDKTIIGQNREWGFNKAHEMIKKAYEYACSQYTKEKFAKDEEVIKSNMAMEGIEAIYNGTTSTSQSSVNEKENTMTKKPSSQNDYRQQNNQNYSKATPSNLVWKSGWFWAFIIFCLVVFNWPKDTSKQRSTSSITPTPYSTPKSNEPTTYQLKSQIEELDGTIRDKEVKLQEVQERLDSKNKAIEALKSKIEGLESSYNTAWYGKEQLADDYNQSVDSHNVILEAYQKDYLIYQGLYEQYEQELTKRNNLVAEYNKRIR